MRTIPAKESLEVEFKSDIKKYSDADLIDEIVGMANTKGGVLYLGVEDDGEITGVHPKHRDAIGVTALIANSTVPSVSVRAEIITEAEKDILKIEIPVSRTVVSASSGKMLRRRLKADGSPEIIPMYSYEIVTRLSELALLDFSAGPLAGATVEDFDSNQRVRLRSIIQITNDLCAAAGGAANVGLLFHSGHVQVFRLGGFRGRCGIFRGFYLHQITGK